jgi:hypothetical protein
MNIAGKQSVPDEYQQNPLHSGLALASEGSGIVVPERAICQKLAMPAGCWLKLLLQLASQCCCQQSSLRQPSDASFCTCGLLAEALVAAG